MNKLKTGFLLVFVFAFFSCYNLTAQTTVTGTVVDSLNIPIPFASVYLSKTTIGTVTNNKGIYLLSIPQGGVYELIASCIGYKLKSLIINADGKKHTINVKLYGDVKILNEVTISAKDRNRRKNINDFIKTFIGETPNSDRCEILNPEDLHLYRDKENNILTGYSLKPLKIENRALGYTVFYDLIDYNYDINAGLIRYSGYNYYEPFVTTQRKNEILKRRRLSAYYGSKMHFLRALFLDSLSRESYQLLKSDFDKDTLNDPGKKPVQVDSIKYDRTEIAYFYSAEKSVQTDSVRFPDKRNLVRLFHKDTLVIKYTGKNSERTPEQQEMYSRYPKMGRGYVVMSPKFTAEEMGLAPKTYFTKIIFSDTVKLYQNGYYYKPYSLIWAGEMARERIADMLPYDFMPYDKGGAGSDTIYNNQDIFSQGLDEVKTGQVAEKVYLHLDRNIYNSGDDIWFKAYVINPSDNRLSEVTNNLHVELIAQDSVIVMNRTLRIEGGIGNGDFILPDSIPSGEYRIRAYTNHMRNYYDNFFFIREIKIINPYDEVEGYVQDKQKIKNKTDISFFPEGGSLVYNIESTVAFKAINALGKGCDVKGELFSSSGEHITSFKSTHLGMGFFTLKPVPGLSYYATVKSSDGSEAKTGLPAVLQTGVTVSAIETFDKKLLITARTNEETLAMLIGQKLPLIISLRNLLNKTIKIELKSLVNNFLISVNDFPDGILKITISKKDGLPLSERLVYFQKSDDVYLKIATDKPEYKPREKVAAAISLSGGSSFSGAGELSYSAADVRFTNDSSSSPTSIVSWFLLESDVHGPVEKPAYYFDPSNENRHEDLDLLLLTQGWRDFKWKYDNKGEFNHEIGFTISGNVIKDLNKKPLTGVKINMGLFSEGKSRFMDTKTDGNGVFSFNELDFPGKVEAFISATGKFEKKQGRILINSINYEPAESKELKADSSELIISPSILHVFQLEAGFKLALKKKYKLTDTINVGEVTITAKKIDTPQEIKVAESRIVYGKPDREHVVTPAEENTGVDPLNFINGRIAGVRVMHDPVDSTGDPTKVIVLVRGCPALVLLDGHEVEPENYFEITSLLMIMIDRIDVINASPLYGMRGACGAVNIITRMGIRRPPTVLSSNAAVIKLNGFDAPRIFYSPKYDDTSAKTYLPDIRTTIHWEPNISIKDHKGVILNYFNADDPAKISITVEGITKEGIPVTGRASYEVK